MSTKHTLGEWDFEWNRNSGDVYIGPKSDDGPGLASAFLEGGVTLEDEGENEANLLLITAAPELLEAAKELLDNTAPDPDDPVWSRALTSGFVRWDDLVSKLRAAIAKAEDG